jgi:hypothetical protein
VTEDDDFRTAFLDLVDDVCGELGYPPRGEAPESDEALAMEMELDGIPFAVVHMRNIAVDRILVECCFGPIPEEHAEQVLYRILQLNRGFADMADTAFGIDPETGDLIYTAACNLASASGRSLLDMMTEMTWQARQWHATYFLDEANAPSQDLPLHLTSLA